MLADKQTPVVFTGRAGEYFGIWIVNLLLSILTLGIYSAWAKVRRKKYFYQHTFIDGVAFDYHASPIAILKGRIIALIALLAYSFSGSVSPILAQAVGVLLFLCVPWIVVRSRIFNARNSSHRGLRFDFTGKVSHAVGVYVGLPILTALSLGLAHPYAVHQRTTFLMNGHRYGLTQAEMQVEVKAFYKLYFKSLLLALLLVAAAVGAISMIGYKGFGTSLTGKLAKAASVGVFVMGLLLLMAIVGAYLQARLANLTWNSTHLDHIHFQMDMRARDLAWIYVSNLLLIFLSFGLLAPWAHIRVARYHASRLRLLGEADLDRFVGEKKAEMKATGEEFADFFDVDLAFG